MRLTRPLAGLLFVAAGVLACGSETTQPVPVPTSLLLSSNNVSFNALGASQQISATVRDQNDEPIAGLTATFVSGDPAVATVNATGLITAVANGSTTVTVSHGSLEAPIAVGVAQVVSQLAKTGGDQQTAEVGTLLVTAIEVELRDSRGNPVPGGVVPNTTVQFAAANGGSVTNNLVVANAGGRASTTWTLGTGVGTQQVDVSLVGGSATTQFSASATASAADTLALVSGDSQIGQIGVPLTDSLVVRVVDAFGNLVSGHQVTFSATAGGAVSPVTVTTGANGQAATEWTLGPGVGAQSAQADAETAISGSPVSFSATATNPQAASVVVFEGADQIGLVGFALNTPPAVRVLDQVGDPFPGATVDFQVETGGGSITAGSTVSDANGVARVGSWTIGGSAGANTLSATVTGSGITGNPVTFTATGQAAAYTIVITYQAGTNPTAAQQAAFDNAAAFWQTIIFQDQADAPLNVDASACGIGIVNKTIDDIEIFVTFAAIDGVNGTLAQAGRCDTSPPTLRANGLPVLGVMTMDNADLPNLEANGTLQPTITHEMGHALGFDGAMFSFKTFLTNPSLPSSPGADTHFDGPQAIAAMNASGGSGYAGAKVPLENNAISGQADSHWRESVFDAELMTPFIEAAATPMPVSRVTAAALLDLGYGVNLAGAQTFSLSAPPLAAARAPGIKISLGADAVFYRITSTSPPAPKRRP
jgi:hypothetical protein